LEGGGNLIDNRIKDFLVTLYHLGTCITDNNGETMGDDGGSKCE
jgi:hypothetical protein